LAPSTGCPAAYNEFFLLCFDEDFNINDPSCSAGCIRASANLEAVMQELEAAQASGCFNEFNVRQHFGNATTPFLFSKLGKGICKTAVSDASVLGASFLGLVAFLAF
jgi:hypothetical protein